MINNNSNINHVNYLSQSYNDQAGCIPIRIKKNIVLGADGKPSISSLITLDDIQIMLVTSGTSGINWVFPKGSIKKSEKSKQAAKRETFEEAGIKGKFLFQIPKVTLADHNKGVNITYYPLFVGKKKNTKREWMEQSKRTRKWFRLSNVFSLVVPIKPHIEAAIISLQRSIGPLLQQINTEFNLANVPCDKFPSAAITEYIVDQCKMKKKKDRKEKKDKRDKKKKLKKQNKLNNANNNNTTSPESSGGSGNGSSNSSSGDEDVSSPIPSN